ncbi:hypothetical protein Moror_7021 [Moniliophthora roreri MCA 2997]|uniref:Uncharacterized protein n=2 Tax=Moniliophthora roreri TaxID=221103 RepID=V2XBD9_MONRO|nr:hypothetical protein Moror_7021 [Moniliophthora roreri MCA 2997]
MVRLSVTATLVALTLLLSPAIATPTRETNAQRMARGLPPLPPQSFGEKITGVKATRAQDKRAYPSPSSIYGARAFNPANAAA